MRINLGRSGDKIRRHGKFQKISGIVHHFIRWRVIEVFFHIAQLRLTPRTTGTSFLQWFQTGSQRLVIDILVCRRNETLEQRMRLVRLALEFRMKLARDVKRVVR